MSDLPPLPDPAYIYHPSFGEPGTDEYVSDDLYDFLVSGPVDEGQDGFFGCDRCVRLYTKEHMYAYRAALAQPAQEPVGIVREVVMHACGDYAIEHAGYLASAAERYIDAVCAADLVREIHIETGDLGDSYALNEADELLSEYQRTLTERIYEFRKRRDRAAAPEGEK